MVRKTKIGNYNVSYSDDLGMYTVSTNDGLVRYITEFNYKKNLTVGGEPLEKLFDLYFSYGYDVNAPSINEFINIPVRTDSKKMLMRQHVGEVKVDGEEIATLSTNLNGVGLYIEKDGNIFGIDVYKFVDYVLENEKHLLEVIEEED